MIIFENYDLHVHSCFSFDAESDELKQLCKAAAKKKLEGIAICDHYEITAPHEDDCFRDNMVFDIEKRKEALYETEKCSPVKILHGIELGSASHNIYKADEILKNSFDFVVSSVHRVMGIEDFYHVDYKNTADEKLFEFWLRYLLELKEEIGLGIGQTIAHITYPLRYYAKYDKLYVLDYDKRFEEYYEDVLKLVIASDMALEVNTSGLRQGLGCTLPDERLLRFYKELGGEKLSLGSDAHCAKDIGANFEDARELIRSVWEGK